MHGLGTLKELTGNSENRKKNKRQEALEHSGSQDAKAIGEHVSMAILCRKECSTLVAKSVIKVALVVSGNGTGERQHLLVRVTCDPLKDLKSREARLDCLNWARLDLY